MTVFACDHSMSSEQRKSGDQVIEIRRFFRLNRYPPQTGAQDPRCPEQQCSHAPSQADSRGRMTPAPRNEMLRHGRSLSRTINRLTAIAEFRDKISA